MAAREQEVIRPGVLAAEERGRVDGERTIVLRTKRGPVETRLAVAPGAAAAAVLVGGVGGGFDTPARGLYPRLGEELPAEGISVLRVRFRFPTILGEAVHDVLAGIGLLATQGVRRIGLVGHSFGGAVVVTAGVVAPEVATVVTLATQAAGTEGIAALAPRPVLLIHGADDRVLSAICSEAAYRAARGEKELRVIEGAGHVLDEAAEEVHGRVRGWLARHLAAGPRAEVTP